MITHVHIYNKWLCRAALMLVMLTGVFPVMSQEDEIEGGEAFYIYQNDGHFDGFFYDQVKQISYSRFDTLGIEHEDYVSQEIVTADSTYRIMLTAIDSVSFVQPEIKFAKGLRFMRDEGMMDYYVSVTKTEDGYVMRFRDDMPVELRPRVDDVLSNWEFPDYEEGIIAKVKSLATEDGQLVVTCGRVQEMSDIFEQFITVEEIKGNVEESGVRRRIAGWNKARRLIEGNWQDMTLFSMSRDFEDAFTLPGGIKALWNQHVGLGIKASATYNISPFSKFYLKLNTGWQIDLGLRLSIDGSAEFNWSPKNGLMKLARIPIPSANVPLSYIDLVPKPFIKGEAHLNVGLSTGLQSKAMVFGLEMLDKDPYVRVSGNICKAFIPIPDETEKQFDITAEISGSMQAGLVVPFCYNTLDALEDFLSMKFEKNLYIGPKLSGNIVLASLKQESDPYKWGLKQVSANLSMLSIDDEYSYTFKFWGRDRTKKWVSNWTFGDTGMHLYPEVKDMTVEIGGERMNVVTARYKVEGDVCIPQNLGFALYKKDKPDNPDDKSYTNFYKAAYKSETYFWNTYNEFVAEMHFVEPGVYMVRPIIDLVGPFELVQVFDEEQLITIAPFELALKPDVVNAEEDGGDYKVDILGSIDGGTINALPDDYWMETSITHEGIGNIPVLNLKVLPNDTDKFRTSTVTVTQILNDGSFTERKLTVNQYGGLQVEPSQVSFEAEGGEKTVAILTSMSPVTFNIKDGGSDWLYTDYDREKRIYKIEAKKNEGAPRKCTITVGAWSEKYQGISVTDITVKQEGLVDVTLDPEALEYEANGGTQTVSVNLGSGDGGASKYEFTGILVDDDDKEWVLVEKLDNRFNVTVLPNTMATERITYIKVNFTKKDTEAEGPATYSIPIKITQAVSEAKVADDELRFEAEGGKLTTKIDYGIFTHCGAFLTEDVKWLKFNIEGDGTVIVEAEENPSALMRETTLVCYVSGVDEPTDNEMLKMPVRIVQKGMTIIPDGEDSPFNYVNFWATRKSQYFSEDIEADTIVDVNLSFNFKPEYSHFTYEEKNGIIHITCQGYKEDPGNTQSNKTTAVISFDIDKAREMVSNLKFSLSGETIQDLTLLPFTNTHMVTDFTSSLATGEFPLQKFASTYKEGKYSVGEGLTFGDYTYRADMRASYTLLPPLDPKDTPDPVTQHIQCIPIGDGEDYVWLMISMKPQEPTLEWPTDEVMESLKEGGMPINEGGIPPTVEGTYALSPIGIVSDKIDVSEELSGVSGVVLKFSGQEGGILKVDYYFTAAGESDYAMGDSKSLIMGKGNDFTICIPGEDGMTILSGTIEDGAITDLHMASTPKDVPNKYVILHDGDGYSGPTTWNPKPDDEE